MITLTNPPAVTTTLGSAGKTNYDRLNLATINYDVVAKSISGQCQLISSANPAAAVIQGSYSIPTAGQAILNISIPTLLFTAALALTTAQQAVVQTWIVAAQNAVEAGLVSVGVVAGVQTSGS